MGYSRTAGTYYSQEISSQRAAENRTDREEKEGGARKRKVLDLLKLLNQVQLDLEVTTLQERRKG